MPAAPPEPAVELPSSSASGLNIRAFRPNDAVRISRLLTQNTPYRRDAAFWLWFNRTLPTQPSLVAVAEVGQELVGHYAILPLPLKIAGHGTVLAGHGVHAFVHPEYRRKVSIFQITAHAYQLAASAGVEIVYGFPNPKYRLIQEKMERWRCVARFKAWTKPVAGVSKGSLQPADLGDDSQLHTAVQLWEEMDAVTSGIRIAGQTRWWTVRYLMHPQRPYSLQWFVRGRERLGFIVSKLFTADGETRAHVVDYALTPRVSPAELLESFESSVVNRAQRLVHWPVDSAFTLALAEAGYCADGFEAYLGFRRLKAMPASVASVDPLLTQSWRLPMGLSDAF